MKTSLIIMSIISTIAIASVAMADMSRKPTIQFNGGVEIEQAASNGNDGLSTSSIELALAAQVNEQIDADVVLLHEDDVLGIDVAALNIGLAGGWAMTLGQTYVPFGRFESHMVSDPLTLELAEAVENIVLISYATGPAVVSVYSYNGSSRRVSETTDKTDNFGVDVELAGDGYLLALGYINDLGDSDTIQQSLLETLGNNVVNQYIAATSVTAMLEVDAFSMVAEFIQANQSFDATELSFNGQGAKPAAAMIEAGYHFALANKAAVVALGYQQTQQAQVLGLPAQRSLVSLSVDTMKNVAMALEVARDTDYGQAVAGNAASNSTITAQLAVAF